MTTTTELRPTLEAARIYLAFDRFVCGTTQCAGSTAVYTGRTIDGVKLTPITDRDVAEWATYGQGPLRCECGKQARPVSVRAAQSAARALAAADLTPVQDALFGASGDYQEALF